jgi:hypothetical protein
LAEKENKKLKIWRVNPVLVGLQLNTTFPCVKYPLLLEGTILTDGVESML